MHEVIESQNPRGAVYIGVVIKYLLLALTLTPIITFRSSLVFPYTFSKFIFFRSLIEIGIILFVIRIVFFKDGAAVWGSIKKRFFLIVRQPVMVALLVLLGSMFISTIFATDRFHAFWGNVERGGGLFNIIHYFLFLFLSTALFSRKDWMLFIKISLLVGVVVIVYGWLQWMGVQSFPFALLPTERPGSFLDNPAFFATYLLFLLTFAAVQFLSSPKGSGWRYFSGLVIAGAGITIFLTNVRGGLAGFLGAIFFLLLASVFKKREKLESGLRFSWNTAVIGLALLVSILAIFWATRHNAFWQAIPGLNRIADIGFDDASLQSRLNALQTSYHAFMEKPVIGWGVENYQVGYNKYFDPQLLLYEDAWFDRAHNIFAEIAVTQGLIGLLAYLALFVVLFFALFRFHHEDIPRSVILVLASGVLAYGLQNIFLFDHPVGFFMFVVCLGFISSLHLVHEGWPDIASSTSVEFKIILPMIMGWVVVLGGIVFLYLYTIIPFQQSRLFYGVLQEKVGEKVLAAVPQFFRPYNYLQPTIRFRFLEILTEENLMRDSQFDPLTNIALQAVEEVVEKEPRYDPRNYIKLAEAYNERGKDRPEFFKDAEEFARQGLALSPRRPSILYPLAFALAGQDRFGEAIAVARETVALNLKLAKSHFNLGLMLALGDNSYWDEAQAEFVTALELDGMSAASLGAQDLNNLTIMYKEMIFAYIVRRDATRIVRVAEQFKRIAGAPVEDLDAIILLAKSGDWETLDATVRGDGKGGERDQ